MEHAAQLIMSAQDPVLKKNRAERERKKIDLELDLWTMLSRCFLMLS